MEEKNYPTMIIPNGTEIAVNEQGQLSIRTPGNLVIQNTGQYSVIESTSGSVRIDPEVKVEAVSIQAADSCFVAGELTAWRVKARKITLEKGAQANIMLQESEGLELDRNARLVGNFASEKELYLMLGRFTRQLRQLPEGIGPGAASERIAAKARPEEAAAKPSAAPSAASPSPPPTPSAPPFEEEEPFIAPDGEDEPGFAERQNRHEVLSLVRVILEREIGRASLADGGRSAVERLLEMVRLDDIEGLEGSYQYLLSQVEKPSDELENAGDMLRRLFEKP
jgi:hypothetical protein